MIEPWERLERHEARLSVRLCELEAAEEMAGELAQDALSSEGRHSEAFEAARDDWRQCRCDARAALRAYRVACFYLVEAYSGWTDAGGYR